MDCNRTVLSVTNNPVWPWTNSPHKLKQWFWINKSHTLISNDGQRIMFDPFHGFLSRRFVSHHSRLVQPYPREFCHFRNKFDEEGYSLQVQNGNTGASMDTIDDNEKGLLVFAGTTWQETQVTDSVRFQSRFLQSRLRDFTPVYQLL